MNRLLNYVNLAGVAALCLLCASQWQLNSRINLKAIELERVRVAREKRLGEQAALLKNNSTEIDDLQDRLGRAGETIKQDESKLAACADERRQLTTERDQLKHALDEWMKAVAERDKTIKAAGEEITKLVSTRDQAIAKFNDLATKYNSVVKELNGTREKPIQGR